LLAPRAEKKTMMKKISELFDVTYGVNLELNSLSLCDPESPDAVNFVSRTSRNNGVSATVELIAGHDPLAAGTLSVAAGGSVMETFLQPRPYYSGRDLYCLAPKFEMSDAQKLYYCVCIRANKYRYNYGRQANRTLRDIFVPDIDEVPKDISEQVIPDLSGIGKPYSRQANAPIDSQRWRTFQYSALFDIQKGKRVTKQDMISGDTPFVSATDKNNGIRQYAGLVELFKGNCITVSYNGSVGEAFYQEQPFWASDDINVLVPKFELNRYVAMFIITMIRAEKYRFNYGRKWHKERMEQSTIRLPSTPGREPDFAFMEKYIKSLPYSRCI